MIFDLGLTSTSKLDWGSYIICITKTASKKIEAFLRSYFHLRLLCISINLSYDNLKSTVVMSALVLLVTAWNCWISYKSEYA